MNETNGITDSSWIWGSVWIFYALFYGRYFKHVAKRLKPDLKLVDVQGSPERLARKALSCKRFAFFLTIPTVLEFIRPTDFTHGLITLAPCVFGIWVMYSVWSEVFRSKVPKADPSSAKYRERS
ncbi:hypothetical protein IEN85_12130 [Pelagicoccus sp. NFK12]|uniref:Uncharacterized protein n=1 Tax=Pelagicoccus enzymogenes TaxID=2773457 RepID=A0A927F857_9BACT|nr:hypothetical protein [Pelagicoccus enzymogenes]MBD5780242.1 hypothetical protein [Pelagicoccus enzymogenes]MDQ8198495.1 hypothetical protein [Pelagicoccus enzymogenes]